MLGAWFEAKIIKITKVGSRTAFQKEPNEATSINKEVSSESRNSNSDFEPGKQLDNDEKCEASAPELVNGESVNEESKSHHSSSDSNSKADDGDDGFLYRIVYER